jgi:hypothetical protein
MLALQVNSGTDAVAGVSYQSSSLVIELQADRLRNEPLVWLGSARVVRERRASGRFFRFSLKFLPSRSSTVHTRVVLCPGAEVKKKQHGQRKTLPRSVGRMPSLDETSAERGRGEGPQRSSAQLGPARKSDRPIHRVSEIEWASSRGSNAASRNRRCSSFGKQIRCCTPTISLGEQIGARPA